MMTGATVMERTVGIAVHQFICLEDNFGLLVRDDATGAVATIDAPDGEAIAGELARLGWRLTDILLTHHHLDHVQGAPHLKSLYPAARIVGAKRDVARLPLLDLEVDDGDVIAIGESKARVIAAPGHTSGHILYYFEADGVIFVGDTLFSLGCGRVFEGTMATMFDTLAKIAALPDETRVYCGHEYTQSNGKFAATVDPLNPLLLRRIREVDELRGAGRASLPTTVGLERATNPFLRADDADVRQAMGMAGADPVAVFAAMRERKNRFAA
jgi:hydroxyacylglutathione hydrolase